MKTGKVGTLVLYIFSPLLLLILFSLSLSSVSDKHDMFLVSTYDIMVVMRKSSGVSLFFMLSFIIITISLGSGSNTSSRPCVLRDHLDSYFPSSSLMHEMNNMIINNGEEEEEEEVVEDYLLKDYDNIIIERVYSSEDDNSSSDEGDIIIEQVYNSEDDKELERRIEEFIAKVNQNWREEWLTDSDSLLCFSPAY